MHFAQVVFTSPAFSRVQYQWLGPRQSASSRIPGTKLEGPSFRRRGVVHFSDDNLTYSTDYPASKAVNCVFLVLSQMSFLLAQLSHP